MNRKLYQTERISINKEIHKNEPRLIKDFTQHDFSLSIKQIFPTNMCKWQSRTEVTYFTTSELCKLKAEVSTPKKDSRRCIKYQNEKIYFIHCLLLPPFYVDCPADFL